MPVHSNELGVDGMPDPDMSQKEANCSITYTPSILGQMLLASLCTGHNLILLSEPREATCACRLKSGFEQTPVFSLTEQNRVTLHAARRRRITS